MCETHCNISWTSNVSYMAAVSVFSKFHYARISSPLTVVSVTFACPLINTVALFFDTGNRHSRFKTHGSIFAGPTGIRSHAL